MRKLSVTWTLEKEEVRRLDAIEMETWRRIEGISWKDRVTNEDVLGRA